MLLHAENEETYDSGFYRDRIDGGMPEKLLMAAKAFKSYQSQGCRCSDVYRFSRSISFPTF